jgi:hypothetical protein
MSLGGVAVGRSECVRDGKAACALVVTGLPEMMGMTAPSASP